MIQIDFIRFLLVGLCSSLINYGIYIFFYSVNLSLFAASAAGYVTGMCFSYHFGRTWVFSKLYKNNMQNMLKFVSVYVVGGLGMSAIIEILVRYLHFDYRASWIVGVIFATINNYLGSKELVFIKGVKK